MPNDLADMVNVLYGGPSQVVPPPETDAYRISKGFVQNVPRVAGEALGINDAARVLRGEMSEDEQQQFALSQMLGLLPAGKGLSPALASLMLLPRATDRMGRPVAKNARTRAFDIVHSSGNPMSEAHLTRLGPEHLWVNWVGNKDYLKNWIGPKELRSLIPQINMEYPKATMLGGERVSGARTGGVPWGGGNENPYIFVPLRPGIRPVTGDRAMELATSLLKKYSDPHDFAIRRMTQYQIPIEELGQELYQHGLRTLP